jgi:CubicO group peptidase (beta-lactamase class C family)
MTILASQGIVMFKTVRAKIIVKLCLPIALMLVFGAFQSFAQSTQDEVALDRAADRLLADYRVPGASVAYLRDGKLVFQKGYGSGDAIIRTRVDADTVFQAGSIGKPVAAYIAVKLAAEGKLDLDRPIAEYIRHPWIDRGLWAKRITVRQLLTHRSGLSNSLLPMDTAVHFEPGSKFGYSGVGYAYLTRIIEEVTGKPFNEVAKAYVFQPFGMSSSSFDLPFVMTGNVARPSMELKTFLLYCLAPFILFLFVVNILGLAAGLATGNRFFTKRAFLAWSVPTSFILELVAFLALVPKFTLPLVLAGLVFAAFLLAFNRLLKRPTAAFSIALGFFILSALFLPLRLPVDITPSGSNAAYSLTTTAGDLARFGRHFLGTDEADVLFREMSTEQVVVDSRLSWGLGMGIEKDPAGLTYWHSGINPGSMSLMAFDPASGRGIVVLTNGNNGLEVSKRLAEIALGFRGKWDVR